ncbi:metal-sulfur cluster assembly factor [Uliginosibacterium sp. sgz301328]|uniref:metal-sulfur cluster assembly factor n=1 Tax=Uliginosibacterium sp. sgz301328 TaxID=3243764 RepID=UPI00359CC809
MSELTDRLREALRTVIDPEVGMNIVDLGLVYRIEEKDGVIQIDLTMTSPACPMGESIAEEAEQAARSCLPPSQPVDLALVWDPPWSPARMTDAARAHFGWGL